MDGGFHGRTLSTLSATGKPKAQEGFAPLVAGFHCIPYDDVQALLDLEGGPEQIVAVMLEPVQGENGVVAPRPGYLQALRTICDRNGWLLVLDEVQTGLCRTGAWFAYQHENIRPDIATLAKSLGNGLPIGACLAAGTAANLFTPGSHGSTFGRQSLGRGGGPHRHRADGRAKTRARAAELGTIMLARFKAELGGLKEVIEVRGKGLMIGIELARPCAELVARSLERRLLINVAAEKVVRLLPPLIISDAEMNEIIDVVCALIKDFGPLRSNAMPMPRHFLTLGDLDRAELDALLARAAELKQAFKQKRLERSCPGRVLAMVFEKSSTRTRVSFETAMAHLGGCAIYLPANDTQLQRGEPVEDTARVLSNMVDGVMLRTYEHEKLARFAENADVPVINGLSDSFHPCQLLATCRPSMS